ncbi:MULTISPECIES: hypothetical protein [Comamonas]|jgi:hypothetical protein|uniref:hypothetical protein n=1 Tax=Comamonas TaxID=283 RepID=UPI0012C2AFE0|nr:MULTISPECIES: hypothetical protein [Comamonas]MDR3066482.1 hypothetical protein [Comamonas sp.]MEB5965358.1 hypothetical protein [Comamonas testosteroni]MPS94303.1 hypothetical protein [Comamonas sp.]
MNLVKTPEGQQAFKERHADLSQRLRSAFLLFDGHRSLVQVLEATSALGVVKDDILALVDRGWLATRESSAAASASKSGSPSLAPAELGLDVGQKRYQKAYPMAVSITGALGLKGFRLNLAVEAAMGYEQLVELAPRIRDAAGEKAYMPLHRALFEADA